MAKRKRLTPALGLSPAPEIKSILLRAAPIAQVASEVATTAALQDLSDLVSTARAEGRLIQALPLASIEAAHLVRDRLLDAGDEDMGALTDSLRTRGQQTPLDVVALDGGRYGLISGLRRLTALTQLGAETALARIIAPETAADAYVSMIEENEIRASLSLYERARIVAKAVEAGVFPDTRDALLTLYAATPRAKRSKIKSVVGVVDTLDGALRFPTQLSERACLDLARALEGDPGLAEVLRARLGASLPETPEAEAALLAQPAPVPAVKSVEIEQNATQIPNTERSEEKNSQKIIEKYDQSHTMQTDKTHEKSESADILERPNHAFEPVPGIYVQCQTDMQGQTRLVYSGPKVNNALRQRIDLFLHEVMPREKDT